MTNYNTGASKVEILVMYKECLHNHAAQAKGYIHDGCGHFEAIGPNGTPEAMVCDAWRCHRNFHQRVEVDLPICYDPQTEDDHQQRSHAPNFVPGPEITNLSPQPQVEGSSGEQQQQATETENAGRRKRLTRAQGERLRAIAESNDRKMFREYSKDEVEHICSEIGIKRSCLKSWICNQRSKRGTGDAAFN